jgi:hypothetical protein
MLTGFSTSGLCPAANFEKTNRNAIALTTSMVERILPFFQRGEKALRWAGQPKA